MENDRYIITKSDVECYKLRHTNGMYWAVITIDEADTSGRIQIASDFGNWQNYWGACGESFKKFLTGLKIDYAATKFEASNWFDLEATIKSFTESVGEAKKNGFISKELFLILKAQISECSESSCKEEFMHVMYKQSELMDFFDHAPDICTDVEPGFRKFWETIWPAFIDVLN